MEDNREQTISLFMLKITQQRAISILLVITAVLSLLLIVSYFIKNKKIAYVDSMKIYNGYVGIKQAKAEFEKEVEFYKSRTDTLTAKAKVAILKMEKSGNNSTEYGKLSDSVQFYKRQLLDYQSAMNESLKQKESQLTQKAMLKLNSFLKEYGNSEGYDMILIANPSGTIAFAKDSFDITDDVLKAANEKF